MNFQKATDIHGLVLAGGKSTRMGIDKSLLSFHGLAQNEHVFALLHRHSNNVYTSIGKGQETQPFKNPIVDVYDVDSPINGILSAFQQNADVAWLSVPVDMPFVNDDVIATLIANRDVNKVATCFYDSEEKYPEPLLTIWEPGAGQNLLKFFERGRNSPREFLMGENVNLLKIADRMALRNINTIEEFIAAKRSLER